jgi:hypothetical protein
MAVRSEMEVRGGPFGSPDEGMDLRREARLREKSLLSRTPP